ncbi:zinc finger protein 483-like [Teleopsis dalmanni]|nr:zinc finger protein 483-like [Teleopsis dalmanni]XP_037928631.1 zinc finger protein 483-like [Teleopsis dalmanni]XP_037929329.1 zinc finger protein 483-like [Teleopsis dalmanni]XP_037946452.1 zinc finger protein 483-like [Teleopsis dalmanni]
MLENTYPNLEKLCRLCLKVNGAIYSIHPTNDATTNMSIPMRIMACTSLEVQRNDDLPKYICAECRYQLEKSYLLRKRSQATDSKLRKHLRLINSGRISQCFIKTDDDDEDEIEFEDSLNFIKQIDHLKLKAEDERRANLVEKDVVKKLSQYKKEIYETCKSELRDEVKGEVKREIIDEVLDQLRYDLRKEVEKELRKTLLPECKALVKNEIQQECREQERKELLGELEVFISNKRLGKDNEPNTNTDFVPYKRLNPKRNAKEANDISEKTMVKARLPKRSFIEQNAAKSNNKMKILEKFKVEESHSSDDKATPFLIITENDDKMSDDDDSESNFFIYEPHDSNDEEMLGDNEKMLENNLETENFEEVNTDNIIEENSYDETENENIPLLCSEDDDINEDDDKVGVYKIFKMDDIIEFQNVDNIPDIKNKSNKTYKKATLVNSVQKVEIKETKTTTSAIILKTFEHNGSPDIPKTFKCKSCPMAFSTEYGLNIHMKTHSKILEKGVSYKCSVCHVIFSCKSVLTRHFRIHTGDRPHKCEICGKSFVQREVLTRHMYVHSGERKHQCTQCDRSFIQKICLTQHIKKVHSAVPHIQYYNCHLCPKRFNYASGLSRHLGTHSGLIFQCTQCDRKFSDHSSVKRHVQTVHGEPKPLKEETESIEVQINCNDDILD